MNLTGREPYQKTGKPKAKRKPMRRVSKKRAAFHASDEGQADLDYMEEVRKLPCCVCGTRQNVKAHHCRDMPPLEEQGIYTLLPAAGRKSGARDTIPLCEPRCHNSGRHSYHMDKRGWRERNGPDYGFIAATRRAVARLLGR